MKKDMIFFGQDGLTDTSANFIANQAKNSYQELEADLDNVRFVNKDMTIIGMEVNTPISYGTTDISDIDKKLDRVARLKSLIAWIREALKARQRLFDEAEKMSYTDFGIEVPEQPVRPTYLTEDDVVSSWNIKQRNRYYYLETLCSQIGKYIHPDGRFAKEIVLLNDKIHNPKTVSGDGRDTIIYTYTPSIESGKVSSKYMELQQLHRSYQAELNSMKHDVESILDLDVKDKDVNFQHEYLVWSNKMVDCNNRLKVCKNDKLDEIRKLKIVIPDSLKSVYDEVSALGKK